MRFRRALRGGRKVSTCLSLVACLFAAVLSIFSSAQQPTVQATGQITGTVSDPDGAVVTGATIALENQLTHEQNTSKSDGTGFFKFTALSTGVFNLAISAK
jgi:Carboxypeptidase regulatory-like domain